MDVTNIVVAEYDGTKTYVRTRSLTQYDYGQILQFSGVDLPEAYEVYFSCPSSEEAITQVGNADGVTIPDVLLTTGEPITAYLFLHTGEDDGETTLTALIPVKQRLEASDEQPTPEEQSAISQAIAALNVAVEKADVAISHYPNIIEGIWNVWNVDAGEYISTGVEATGPQGEQGETGAQGETGNGIESAVLNADYTLTLTFTDGTSYTTPSIRGAQGEQGIQGERGIQGETGNGIDDAVLNEDYTLTLDFTDGTSYTTPSIRGEKGEKGDPGISVTVQGTKLSII